MQTARKTVKILHTVAAAGLIGGLGSYMILLAVGTPSDLGGYASLRQSISAISDYVLLPSLFVGLVSGLLSMVVHTPFLDRGWVWIKALLGILMFKGVLTIVNAKANYAASMSAKIAAGEAPAGALDELLVLEWWTLVAVMAISVVNVVLGVWRPKFVKSAPARQPAAKPAIVASAPVAGPANDQEPAAAPLSSAVR
ncbi:MAG: DUF2269 family protein [Pseudomonadota bacterium]